MSQSTEKVRGVVTLVTPIKRGETKINTITITPVIRQAGSLRGLKVYDVLTSDYNAMEKLLPRVTSPALTEHELATMETWDFCQLSNEAVDFLQPTSAASASTAMTSSTAPLTE